MSRTGQLKGQSWSRCCLTGKWLVNQYEHALTAYSDRIEVEVPGGVQRGLDQRAPGLRHDLEERVIAVSYTHLTLPTIYSV